MHSHLLTLSVRDLFCYDDIDHPVDLCDLRDDTPDLLAFRNSVRISTWPGIQLGPEFNLAWI